MGDPRQALGHGIEQFEPPGDPEAELIRLVRLANADRKPAASLKGETHGDAD